MLALGCSWIQFTRTVAWPLIVLLLLAYLAATRGGWLADVVRKVRRFSAGSVSFEFELTNEGAKEAKAEFEESFDKYRKLLRGVFEAAASRHQLWEGLRGLVQDEVMPLIRSTMGRDGDAVEDGANPTPLTVEDLKLRATLHVQDILFRDALYQLLDYCPRGRDGGRGRVFSIRFGVVGLAWRLERSVARTVPGGAPREYLIEHMAFTKDEPALAGFSRRSFAAILLRAPEDQRQIGILYLDSTTENAFGEGESQETFVQKLELVANSSPLAKRLEKVVTEASNVGPSMDFYDSYS